MGDGEGTIGHDCGLLIQSNDFVSEKEALSEKKIDSKGLKFADIRYVPYLISSANHTEPLLR
jgi:hypothetical protein